MLDPNYAEKIKRFAEKMQGAPFRDRGREAAGLDCWGLVRLAYRQCFGLELPDLEELPALEIGQVAAAIQEHRRSWRPVAAGRERPGDLAVFRRGAWPCHVGLVVAPGYVLHTERDTDTIIEPFYRGALKARLVEILRHEQLL